MARTADSGHPVMATCYFTIRGAPRTKKTSNRIVRFGRNKEHTRILPSKAHDEWFKNAMSQSLLINRSIEEQLVGNLPIRGPVSVRALYYRDAARGDSAGYYQALGDFLERSGIIADDDQIEHWDGCRRRKDPANPRIEVEMTLLQEVL